MFKYTDCIDSGTEYCPCTLAEKGECIICSQLKDKVFCDCLNWKGTCIYQEFIYNNQKSKKARQFKTYSITDKKYLRDDLLQFDIKVNNTLARELNNIGAFVFIKNPQDLDAYSTPISVLESNIYNNTIRIVFKIIGVKTKSLRECKDKIMIKGPYWNGIQGVKFLNEMKNKNCLILARGCAAAPAVLAAKRILKNSNRVYALLERGRSGENFAKPYFIDMGCIAEDIDFCDERGNISSDSKLKIEELVNDFGFSTVLSAGSDRFHVKAVNFIYNLDKQINFSTVNNSIMCCGEGICGSCQIKGPNNEKIKSCKQQYNPVEIFLRGMHK